jgi:hypothetical protein
VRHKEGGFDVAAVGITTLLVEDLGVEIDVVVVNGVVKGDRHHLGHAIATIVLGTEVAGDFGAVLGAEAIGQLANVLVAGWGAVGIRVDIYKKGKKGQERVNIVVKN